MQIVLIVITMLCISNTLILIHIIKRLIHIEVKTNMLVSTISLLASLIAELKVTGRY